MLADTACPICGEACKLLLPIAAGNYSFSCIIHHDFEVTKAGMEKGPEAKTYVLPSSRNVVPSRCQSDGT